ncbi:MAG: isocitrate/isopropylmalate dehydrogenase family protein, partial [Betaproteobacteria bacterium]|nr:isocitrate/isopropylmalate dehydrogenase family protein [Betaproteobacteria bacterium]
MLKIGILLGDDIGLEVVPETVKVMKAAAAKTGLEIEWHPLPIGRKAHEEFGHTIPPGTDEKLRGLHGWLMGPIGHSAYPQKDPTWVMPPFRKTFELFASVKPVRSYANVPSVHKDMDVVFVREATEGLTRAGTVVAGSGEFRPNDDISIGMRVVTRKGANRVARVACEIAATRARKVVTTVHKAPTFKLVCGMFAEECHKAVKDFPGVKMQDVLIDSFALKMAMKPQQFDVVVTTNTFGDILTDLGAGLAGGLGLAPGMCVGETQAMAQATHGSAPDIAGKGIANPYAMIMSGKMMLEWLGHKYNEPKAVETARVMDAAVDSVIAAAKHLTV